MRANRFKSGVEGYGLAVAGYFFVVGLQILLTYYSIKFSFAIPMVVAILAVTWYGGRHPGLLLAILFETTTVFFSPVPPDTTFTQWIVAQASNFGLLVFIVLLISSRRSVGKQIGVSESRYRTLFEYSPDGIVIADPQSYYLDANETVCQMLGYTREEFIGLHASDILVLEEIPRVGEALEIIKSTSDYHREWVFKRKDGSIFTGEVTATLIPDGNILAVIRDISVRKTAEDASARLAAIVQSSDDAIIGKDINGIVTSWNKAAEELFGYSAEEMEGTSIIRLIPLDRHGEEEQILNRIRRGESINNFETVRQTKSGNIIDVSITVSPIRNTNNEIVGVSKIVRDITERKLAAEKIIHSENQLAEAQGVTHMGSWNWLLSGNKLEWSDEHFRIFGLHPGEIEPSYEPVLDKYVCAEDRDLIMATVEHSVATLEPFNFHYRVIRPDGNMRTIQSRGNVEADENGKAVRMYGTAQDITEKYETEAALQEGEERLRIVTENARVGLVMVNTERQYTYANAAYAEILGLTDHDIVGQYIADVLAPLYEEQIRPHLDLAFAGERVTYELDRPGQDGDRYYAVKYEPLKMKGGVSMVVVVITDITERKMAEKALDTERNLLRTVFDMQPDYIYVKDKESRFLDCNEACAKLMGAAHPSETIGKTDADFYPAELAAEFRKDELSVLNDQPIINKEEPFTNRDGSREIILTSKLPLKDNSGKITGLVGYGHNVTEAKRDENERGIVFEITQGIVSTSNLDEFLKLVHRSIGRIVYAENCFVMLHDPATDMNHFEFWADKHDAIPPPRPTGKGFSSYVLRTGQPLLLTNESKTELIEQGEAVQIGTSSPSWVGVPLRTPSRTIGVLVLQHYDEANAFQERDLEFLSSVGDQIALAIERKWAEEALGDSEERYRLLFEKNPLPMWVYDLQTLAFLEINDAAVHHYGYSRDEFLSMTILDIRPSDDVPTVLKSVEDDDSDLNEGREWRHMKKDGTVIDVEITSHSLSFLGHSARLVLAKDITETKRAKIALSESEELNRDLVENAIDIIYTHDMKGNYLSVNGVAEKITGYSREEVLKMNLADSVAPEYLETARQMIAEKLAGNHITAYEVEIMAKDGHRVTVEVNTRIIYENSVPVRVQGIARDITERKNLEEQFRQAQKMEAIGLLAGGIAHDFNNLLTVINGYTDLTLKRMSEDRTVRDYVTQIKGAGDRAVALTHQLLAFSRKQVLHVRVHNINTVITEIEKMLRRIIKENVELRVILDPELGNIRADPGQIEQVVINLAVNARDAMPNGGTLIIQTENVFIDKDYVDLHVTASPGPYVRLTITDNGEGMDENVQKRIFEPFFTTKAKNKGTGLGLSTVHGIVKQSGGNIHVYSEPGYGTTFKIYLPCVDEIVQRVKWRDDRDYDHSGTETILLVEDEEEVRNLVRDILTGNGYKVLEATSGKAALAIFDTYGESIHLILTDVIMPEMGGSQLRNEITKSHPDLKILFMSGYTDEAITSGEDLIPGTAFIEKPFAPDELTRKIREILSS